MTITAIRTMQKRVWEYSEAKGWHKGGPPETGNVHVAEKLCLIHSEVSEALERSERQLEIGSL